eukprot:CAMPEP_0114427744 /NCGR_PEP_ID=MMETSP0103-20121206/8530_1 /TAXON_ID=37642 ORGANISM="Paraphysomonas imperforata, Strain PA2" /NCGR_SAMPLE_ID=MMETSP0103 /ASSEMBLY_ACC=CAM_ASM_000201 /LENGTH=675 /DNA_ID=CAMNT_0001596863 /DNA_START=57 /DNA_END=2084 /DNA_ORIENTATION=+
MNYLRCETAQVDPSSVKSAVDMNYLSTLPEEVMHLVSSHLTPREIHIFFLMTSKDMKQTFAESYQTWRQVLGTASHDIIMPLLCEYGHDKKLLEDYNNPSSSSYAKMARAIAGMEDLSMGHWRQARYGSAEDLFSEQEAHSSVLLTSPCKQKKYLAVIPGWGNARKEVEVYDMSRLPIVEHIQCRLSGSARYFKYGHSSTRISDHQVIVFGGLAMGGYQMAINYLTVVDVQYNDVVEANAAILEAGDMTTPGGSCEEESVHEGEDVGGKGSRKRLPADISGDDDHSRISNLLDDEGDCINYLEKGNDDDDQKGEPGKDSEGNSDSGDESEGHINNDILADLHPAVEMSLRVVAPSGNDFFTNSISGVPTARGYHSACAVNICHQDYLLVWGGLGNRVGVPGDASGDDTDDEQEEYLGSKTLAYLECMNCSNLQWHTEVLQSGSEPSPRFGHSCTYHPRTNSLIIMGGSDGTDLLRNGEELREVYLLTIVPPLDPPSIHRKQSRNAIDDATTFTNVAFVWSQLRVDCGDAVGLQVPGRCHSASLVSRDKLLVFGGSAFGTTNAVIVMDFKALNTCELKEKATAKDGIQHLRSTLISSTSCRDDDRELKRDAKHCPDHSWTILMHAPIIIGEPPLERLSALCAQVGKYFLIQGGYDTADRDCLNDCQVLDICCSTAQ